MKNKEKKEVIYNNSYQNESVGYVLTPSGLANEMISTLPVEVFESDSTTFLDPICKNGTFLYEIVERLYNQGHSIGNIQKRIYTVDDNRQSLNISNSYIKSFINKESGSFKVDFKYDFIELYFNQLCNILSTGRFKTFEDFMNRILIDKKDSYLMVELKRNISEFIEKYEKVSKLESKLFGEVFTPRQLIDEMLDTLPEDIWKNKDLKWLDPAVGIGNFPAAILDRLMVGLEEVINDEDQRRKHILEEMLYMCDISTKNLFLLYQLFDCNNEFKLNVYRGSFLSEDFDKHMKEVWRLDGFDVVVGNPPYQLSNATGDNKLYLDFSKKSMDVLLDLGNLLFITPKNIIDYILLCDKNRTYFNKFYQIEYMAVDTPSKYFIGVGSTFLYFNLKKDEYKRMTKVKYLNFHKEEVCSEILLERGNSIPNILSTIDLSIISKIRKYNNSFKFKKMKINGREFRIRKKQIDSGIVSILNDDEYKYPVIDGINKGKPFPGKVFYMKENFSDNIPKLIINGSGYLCPSFDKYGEYFLSDNMIYIELENENQYHNILKVLNSKIVKYWLNQFRLNGFSDVKNIQLFPFISLDKEYTDQDLYEYFNLTQEEIDLIEKTIKD